MFKNIFLAAAIVIASPSFVTAQDIFLSFDSQSVVSSLTASSAQTSGSVYVFSDGLFGFDAIDLDFTSSGPYVQFTGGEAFNPTFAVVGGLRFDLADLTIDAETNSGRLLLVRILENGVNPSTSPLFDPGFDPSVGTNGAVLLARVDFDIMQGGATEFNFALGTNGAFEIASGQVQLYPSIGSASLTVDPDTMPILGDVNLDSFVNFLDIAPFISALSSGGDQLEADCNQDCAVNFLDIAPFILILTGQ